VTRDTRSMAHEPRGAQTPPRRGARAPAWAMVLVLALAVPAFEAPAAAQEVDDDAATEALRDLAVQERHHQHLHELNVSFGALPVDAFLKGLAASASYTLHFTDLLAWEVVHGYYTFYRVETDLNDDLTNVGVPNPFNYVSWAATSNVIFTPFYGKYSVGNRGQIFTELYLVAGAGYGWMTLAQGDADATHHLVVDTGLGFRVFFNDTISLRFDLRWEGFFLNVEEPRNELWIALGISFHLG
jgi:outer membrane beta-barrel protein